MNKIDRWIKIINERKQMREKLNLYHIDIVVDMFELDELGRIFEEYKELKEKEVDDGR